MIHVIATIQVAAGQRAEFLTAFHQLMPVVHAEHGCLEYGPSVDVATEIAATAPRQDVVTIIEKWEDLGSLQQHLAAHHMAEFRKNHGHLIANTKIQVLEPA